MQHSFFFDGNSKKIAWIIKNKNGEFDQKRNHADIYYDTITCEQSKYIALHVGLFWGIGRFIMHDEDEVNVKIDSNLMLEQLTKNKQIHDDFISTRMNFILLFIKQRKLKIKYEIIKQQQNLASKLINGKGT